MRVGKVCGRNEPAAVVMRSVRFVSRVAVSAALNIRIHCRSRPNPVATAVQTAGSSSCHFFVLSNAITLTGSSSYYLRDLKGAFEYKLVFVLRKYRRMGSG
jgi:hypothetical protein